MVSVYIFLVNEARAPMWQKRPAQALAQEYIRRICFARGTQCSWRMRRMKQKELSRTKSIKCYRIRGRMLAVSPRLKRCGPIEAQVGKIISRLPCGLHA